MTAGWVYFGFLILYLIHMQEEYWTGFAVKFPPKRFAGPLTEKGFWVLNPLLLSIATIFGIANILGERWAFFWICLWASICLWNAAAHGVWALGTRKYQPGLITGLLYAPLFLGWSWALSVEGTADWNAYQAAILVGFTITVFLAGFAFAGRRIFR